MSRAVLPNLGLSRKAREQFQRNVAFDDVSFAFREHAGLAVAIDEPGQMKWFGRVVRPDVAVWLSVARTHTRQYESLALTSEKPRSSKTLRRRTLEGPSLY
jgi:hypothetical protein